MLTYWYVFIAILVTQLFGILFLVSFRPIIGDMRLGARAIYNVSFFLILISYVFLCGAIVMEIFFGN